MHDLVEMTKVDFFMMEVRLDHFCKNGSNVVGIHHCANIELQIIAKELCCVAFVKFSYTRLDSIVFNSKITTAYQESLIETQSQDRHCIYLGKPSRGRKPSKISSV